MIIKELNIALQPAYAENPGKYVARVTYATTRDDKLELVLDADMSTNLLNFLGPVITKMAIKATEELRANIEQSVIEAQKATKLIEL